MGFIQGDGRTQGTLFPVTLDELIPQDHVCRVIDAFVDRLAETLSVWLFAASSLLAAFGERMSAQRGGDVAAESPGSRSQKHRRVPAHAQRGGDAGGSGVDSFSGIGARRVGSSGWIEVSGGLVRQREAVKRYLESLESADHDEELVVEPSKVAEALKKLQEHKEP